MDLEDLEKVEDSEPAPPLYDVITLFNNQLESALRLKAEANEALKAGEVKEALILYKDAIKVCPPEEKKDLSILYNNRGIGLLKDVFCFL